MSAVSFRSKIEQTAKQRRSKIVLALDLPFMEPEKRHCILTEADNVLTDAHRYLCAVKFNHHLTLPTGLFDGVQQLIRKTHDLGLAAIMDCKVNDIGSTNEVIAQYYYAAGFDALIANPFVGWEEGLEPIFKIARKREKGVILLVYMSHKASTEGYGQMIVDTETGKQTPQYLVFAKKALQLNADGVIVGATYPDKISEIYKLLHGKIPIFSPGVGVQGGESKAALGAGATYLIVGRSITQATSPAKAARQIRDSVG